MYYKVICLLSGSEEYMVKVYVLGMERLEITISGRERLKNYLARIKKPIYYVGMEPLV